MLDQRPLGTKSATWRNHLSVGDVLLYGFPLLDGNDEEPPVLRPCIVTGFTRVGSYRCVVLAPGFLPGSRQRGYEVHVRSATEMTGTGLRKPTSFDLNRRLPISLGTARFPTISGQKSPVLGHLPERMMERLHAVRARIQAERDIAAAKRAEQFERQRDPADQRRRYSRFLKQPVLTQSNRKSARLRG